MRSAPDSYFNSAPDSGSITYTANYKLACYTLTTMFTGSGPVTPPAAIGGVSGFPANCYAPTPWCGST